MLDNLLLWAMNMFCGFVGIVPAVHGNTKWHQVWQEPLLAALCGSSDNLRMRVGIYLLPLVLELDEMSMVDLVAWILEPLQCPIKGRETSAYVEAGKHTHLSHA